MRRKLSIFDTLGVRTSDDLGTIRQAWRRKVKKLHPDVANAQDKSATSEALVTVNIAFDALRDHKPFADRRAANRGSDRRTIGSRKRVWTRAERQSVAQKHAQERREQRARDAARAAKRRKAADALRARPVRKNAETAGKVRSDLANAIQMQKLTLAALRGYSDSLNVISAETRHQTSVRAGL